MTFDEIVEEYKKKNPDWERNDACGTSTGDTSGLEDDSPPSHNPDNKKESPAN